VGRLNQEGGSFLLNSRLLKCNASVHIVRSQEEKNLTFIISCVILET
jgi:hypothetical protein